ncbi:hypothetical protein AB0E27_19600 [Streptomyces sparsogenes]|uniref:hypothetical protein n=1 Tax=Streptomyces sparsogenes TaxID=67365 RepID=UPI0033D7284D
MDGRIPQPHDATDSAQFVAVMRQLRQWANLSYRELERRATAAGDVLPRAPLAGALNRQELPRVDLVAAFVRACGGDEATVKAWVGARKRLAVALESLASGEARHEAERAGAASGAEGPGAASAGAEGPGTESAAASGAGAESAGASGAGAESAGAEDAGVASAGAEDAGAASAGTESAAASGAGTADAGAANAGTAGAGAASVGVADEPGKQVVRAGVPLRPAEVTVPTSAVDETEALTLAEPVAAGRATGPLAAKPPTGRTTTQAANPTTGPTTTPAPDPTTTPVHPEPEAGAKKAWRRLRRPGLVIAATVAIVLLTAAATAMLHPGDDPGEPRKGRPGVPTASHSPSGTPSRPQDGDPSKAAEAEPAKGASPRATTPAATSPAPSSRTTAPEKPKSKPKPTPRHSSRTPEWTPYDPPAGPYDPSPSADDSPTSDGGDPFPEETCWDVTNDCV